MGLGGGMVVVTVVGLVMRDVFERDWSSPSQLPARAVLDFTWSASFQLFSGMGSWTYLAKMSAAANRNFILRLVCVATVDPGEYLEAWAPKERGGGSRIGTIGKTRLDMTINPTTPVSTKTAISNYQPAMSG